jgi:hypothetical protein
MTPITRRAVLLAALTGGITVGIISDAARNPGDVMHRLAELERQITELQTARRLEAASIGRGGLRIHGGGGLTVEGGGNVQVAGGGNVIIRDDGNLHVQDATGALVALSTLAFGVRAAANIVNGSTTTEDAWVDLDFAGSPDPGPVVPVVVGTSGRCIVLVSAHIQASDFAQGWMGFQVTGATSRDPNTLGSATFRSHNVTSAAAVTSTGITLLQGLNPGPHTIEAKYRVSNLGSASFANRVVVALPY